MRVSMFILFGYFALLNNVLIRMIQIAVGTVIIFDLFGYFFLCFGGGGASERRRWGSKQHAALPKRGQEAARREGC